MEGMEGALVVGGPRPLRGLFSIRIKEGVMAYKTSQNEVTEPVGIV